MAQINHTGTMILRMTTTVCSCGQVEMMTQATMDGSTTMGQDVLACIRTYVKRNSEWYRIDFSVSHKLQQGQQFNFLNKELAKGALFLLSILNNSIKSLTLYYNTLHYLRVGSRRQRILIFYTSFESSWWADFKYASLRSSLWRCVMLRNVI